MGTRVVIFGGSGFVGQSIAKSAQEKQFKVICVSRSGKPKDHAAWMDKVTWIEADVFRPNQWQSQVKAGDIVIDAIGILFEKKQTGITYQKFNYEVVPTVIQELSDKKPELFIYISAAHGLPFFSGYLDWKKKAEAFLTKQNFSVAIIYPSLLYSKNKPMSRWMAFPIVQMRKLPGGAKIFGKLNPQSVESLGRVVIQAIEDRKHT